MFDSDIGKAELTALKERTVFGKVIMSPCRVVLGHAPIVEIEDEFNQKNRSIKKDLPNHPKVTMMRTIYLTRLPNAEQCFTSSWRTTLLS